MNRWHRHGISVDFLSLIVSFVSSPSSDLAALSPRASWPRPFQRRVVAGIDTSKVGLPDIAVQ